MSNSSMTQTAQVLMGAATDTDGHERWALAVVDGAQYRIDFSRSCKAVRERKPFYLIRDDAPRLGIAQFYALGLSNDTSDDHPVRQAHAGDSWHYEIDDVNVDATLAGTFQLEEYTLDQETGEVGMVLVGLPA